jgi:myo-inositol-1(or 4)-monophosphatase
VDNRNCKKYNLAKAMADYIGQINDTVVLHPKPEVQFKPDQSPVTKLDLELSELVERIHQNHFSDSVFYSEEKFSDWKFPMLIVDPLDGTREYIEGREDWCLSIAHILDEDFNGEGWIYNPLLQKLFSEVQTLPFEVKSVFQGEVSRWEFSRGLYQKLKSPKFKISPLGSIAYKLARLSVGETDFVVSLTPKNIWDIAGGTILSQRAGLHFYSEGKLVKKVQKNYRPPLIWCHDEIFPELSETFS